MEPVRSRSPSIEICSTCRGVLRLQARWTRLEGAGEARHESVERMGAEARWFVMALEKGRPCPSHAGVSRLAQHLAEEIDIAYLFRAERVECQR